MFRVNFYIKSSINGNSTLHYDPSAEWNIYIDPQAANILFESGAPVTLVPLDACNHARVTVDFLQQLGHNHATAEADFVYTALEDIQGFIESGNYYFWDPLAAAILKDGGLATYERDPNCVIEEEGSQSGQTVVQEGCPLLTVAVTADQAAPEQVLISTLNNP